MPRVHACSVAGFPLLAALVVTAAIPTTLVEAKTFAGYDCIDDCAGHLAGYQWAEEHDIDDPDNCDANSQSFIEGCQAYALGMSPDIEDEEEEDDPPDDKSL